MSAVRTSLVKKDHAWTGTDVPWHLDTEDAPDPYASIGERARWRLFRYLSGGGLAACRTSNDQFIVERRQGRFLVVAGVLGFLWLVFWII